MKEPVGATRGPRNTASKECMKAKGGGKRQVVTQARLINFLGGRWKWRQQVVGRQSGEGHSFICWGGDDSEKKWR